MPAQTSAGIGGLTRPVSDIAQKAQKAGQIKSVKLKIKMKSGKKVSKPAMDEDDA